jgi:hypothetical protein
MTAGVPSIDATTTAVATPCSDLTTPSGRSTQAGDNSVDQASVLVGRTVDGGGRRFALHRGFRPLPSSPTAGVDNAEPIDLHKRPSSTTSTAPMTMSSLLT